MYACIFISVPRETGYYRVVKFILIITLSEYFLGKMHKYDEVKWLLINNTVHQEWSLAYF